METSTALIRQCSTCHILESDAKEPLLHCAKCPETLYCSRECQKTDWKTHKVTCASKPPAQSKAKASSTSHPSSATGAHNPGFQMVNDFMGLDKNEYLHSLPEKEAFAQLIDCFRLRVEDEYTFAANNIGLYAGEDPRPAFKEFLGLAETKQGILPGWWNAEKKKACEMMAVDAQGWSDINCSVQKVDIIEHYGDSFMPMKLRVLGEKIYGRGFM